MLTLLQITFWATGPSTLQSLMSFPGRRAYNISSLQWVVSGGSGMSAETQLRIQRELFKNRTLLTQGYGKYLPMSRQAIMISVYHSLSIPLG